MEATQIDVLFGKRVTGDFFGRSVRDGKSDFTVRFRGLNLGVRMRFHTGIDAQKDILYKAAFFGLPLDRIYFGIGVRYDTADPCVQRFL